MYFLLIPEVSQSGRTLCRSLARELIVIITCVIIMRHWGRCWRLIEIIILNLRSISEEKSIIIVVIIQWALICDKSLRIWCRHVVSAHYNVFDDTGRDLD